MIPIPGDWHFFKKLPGSVYLDAGLGDLAKASGYQINSILSGHIISSLKAGRHYFNIS